MKTPLAPTRLAAASRLCSACLRMHTSARPIASRASSGAATAAPSLRLRPLPGAQRPLSHTSSARRISSSADQIRESEQAPQPTRPRFYALFPETLPGGPPPTGPFHIDTRALRREFLRLQAAAHPDFHHAAADASHAQSAARARAEAASAMINEAYKTLSSPLLRAQYLLHELHGTDLAGDEAGGVAEADPDLLMLVLDTREAIEDAASEEDLAPLKSENDERIKTSEDRLETAFRDGDVNVAKSEAVRLRYWVNIRDTLNEWESGKPVVLHH